MGQPTTAETLLRAGHRAGLGEQVKHCGPGPSGTQPGEVADAWTRWDPPSAHQF